MKRSNSAEVHGMDAFGFTQERRIGVAFRVSWFGFWSLATSMSMSKLDDELAKDQDLWRMWCEDGVTEATPLAVDVFFYATKKFAAEQIADSLCKWGAN